MSRRRRGRRSNSAGWRCSHLCDSSSTSRWPASRSIRRDSRCRRGGRWRLRCNESATSARRRRCSRWRRAHGVYTPAFALRGLGAVGETRAGPVALALATSRHRRCSAARRWPFARWARSAAPPASTRCCRLVADKNSPRNLALEAVTALGGLADPSRVRSACWICSRIPGRPCALPRWRRRRRSIRTAFCWSPPACRRIRDWSVRAALAEVLGTLPADQVRGAIADLTTDADARVRGPALRALAKVGSPDLPKRLFDALDASDFVVRATAADLIGEGKPAGGVERLTAAYARGESDAAYAARASALGALAKYGERGSQGRTPAGAGRQGVAGASARRRMAARAGRGGRGAGRAGAAPTAGVVLRLAGAPAPDLFSPRLHRDPPGHDRARVESWSRRP